LVVLPVIYSAGIIIIADYFDLATTMLPTSTPDDVCNELFRDF